jgi:hypothetical protein
MTDVGVFITDSIYANDELDLGGESERYHISSLAWEWLQQAGADSAFMCQIELWDMAGIPVNNLWSAEENC